MNLKFCILGMALLSAPALAETVVHTDSGKTITINLGLLEGCVDTTGDAGCMTTVILTGPDGTERSFSLRDIRYFGAFADDNTLRSVAVTPTYEGGPAVLKLEWDEVDDKNAPVFSAKARHVSWLVPTEEADAMRVWLDVATQQESASTYTGDFLFGCQEGDTSQSQVTCSIDVLEGPRDALWRYVAVTCKGTTRNTCHGDSEETHSRLVMRGYGLKSQGTSVSGNAYVLPEGVLDETLKPACGELAWKACSKKWTLFSEDLDFDGDDEHLLTWPQEGPDRLLVISHEGDTLLDTELARFELLGSRHGGYFDIGGTAEREKEGVSCRQDVVFHWTGKKYALAEKGEERCD